MRATRRILIVGVLFWALLGTDRSEAGSIVGGNANNSVTPGVLGGTISGGGGNTDINRVTDDFGTVGGGLNNRAGNDSGDTLDARHATVGGGDSNVASGLRSTVGGGASHVASGEQSTIAGGGNNDATGIRATVGGGGNNDAAGSNSTIGGGLNNLVATHATVGGGLDNMASGGWATIGGGDANTASGGFSTVPGGTENIAAGSFSFAAGRQAKIAETHDGTFLWGDSTAADFASVVLDEFGVRASGGFRFRTAADLATGCNLPADSGTFSCSSSREVKEGFAEVDREDVLSRLVEMPIRRWRFRGENEAIAHMGPVAEEFHAAFGLGRDDRTISHVDADGVAMAAIQGLFEIVKDKHDALEERNEEIEARLAEKDAEIAALRELVDTMRTAMADQEARLRAVATASQAQHGPGLGVAWGVAIRRAGVGSDP